MSYNLSDLLQFSEDLFCVKNIMLLINNFFNFLVTLKMSSNFCFELSERTLKKTINKQIIIGRSFYTHNNL